MLVGSRHMDSLVPPNPSDTFWTTPQVAHFLGISRQAINRRVKNRTLLGFSGPGVTWFPAWQFDPATEESRPEVTELLAAVPETVAAQALARWSVKCLDAADEDSPTPAQMLLDPATHDEALAMAGAWALAPHADDADDSGSEPEVPATAWTPSQAGSSGSQHAILLAAADLFARKGPGKVSLREIAAEAGVSYGLIYRFYRTKENLLAAVMDLLVTYGGDFLTKEPDAYSAIENSFGADVDAGQFGRMLTWSVIEETDPAALLGGVSSRGYRSQIDALWQTPVTPKIRSDFDSHVVASVVALVASVWDQYEPYLAELADQGDRDREEVRNQVTDLLKLLVFAARPNEETD